MKIAAFNGSPNAERGNTHVLVEAFLRGVPLVLDEDAGCMQPDMRRDPGEAREALALNYGRIFP